MSLHTLTLLFIFCAIFVVGLIIGSILFWRIRRWWVYRKIRLQHLNAQRGESEAEDLLISHGFRIVARQARTPLKLIFDGDPWETEIAADLIVEKDGYTFVAEVKTGERAPHIESSATRRQLLEYYVTYKPDGVLLVDMTDRRIHTVEFIL